MIFVTLADCRFRWFSRTVVSDELDKVFVLRRAAKTFNNEEIRLRGLQIEIKLQAKGDGFFSRLKNTDEHPVSPPKGRNIDSLNE